MRVSGSGLGAAAGNVFGKALKLFFGLLMVVVILAIGVGIYFFFELGQRPSTKTDEIPFSITKGETFSQITDDLYKQAFIRNTFVFRLRARMLDAEPQSTGRSCQPAAEHDRGRSPGKYYLGPPE